MKFIKLIVISIVALLLLVTVMGLFFPATTVVSRAIDIQTSKHNIQQACFRLENWNQWLPVQDSSIQPKMDGKDLLLNETRISILAVTDSTLVTQWQRGTNKLISTFSIIEHDSSLYTLHWQMLETVGWKPWQRFGTMFNDKILGPTMEQGLVNIKSLSETIEKDDR